MSLKQFNQNKYCRIFYLMEYESVILPLLSEITNTLDHYSITRYFMENKVFTSFIALKDREWNRADYPAKYPYFKDDMIISHLTNTYPDNKRNIYLSLHDSIAKDIMYLKHRKYSQHDLLNVFDSVFRCQIKGLSSDYVLYPQAIPLFDDIDFSRYTLTLSDITKVESEVISRECRDFHFLNEVLIPTFITYYNYSDTNSLLYIPNIDITDRFMSK